MGLFYSNNEFDVKAIEEIMRISCADWNSRFADSKAQAIGIHDDSKRTIEMILDYSEKIVDRLFSGEGSSAFKKAAAFMVVSTIYPFLFARTQGETDGLLNLAGNHIKNFQAYFNIESVPLLLCLSEQQIDENKTVILDQWTGFQTTQMFEETWKFLVNIPQVARVNKPGSAIEYDGFVIGIQILALSLILENAYWAGKALP